MSLGCYIISKKEILINKEAVKDKSRYVSPEKLIINEDLIFIYGDEDENQLIEKILSVEVVHRYGVFSLIFGTLNVYYKDRVKNTLNKLKKADINTYNEVKRLLYTDSKISGSSKSMNKALVNKFCTNCGTKIIEENKFCTTCGEKIIIKPTLSNFEKPKHIKSDFSADQNIKNIELVHQAKIKNAIKNHENKKEKVSEGTNNNNNNTLIVIFSIMFVILLSVILFNSYNSNGSFETVTLTNESNTKIYVSLGFRDLEKDTYSKGSVGWYVIEPNDNLVIDLLLELGDQKYSRSGDLWLYAKSSDGESKWSGDEKSVLIIDEASNSNFFVDDYERFYLESYYKPNQKSSLSTKAFFKISLETPNTNFSFTE